MTTYRVEVTEIFQRQIDIDAQSPEQAVLIIQKQYNNEDIVLDAEDHISTNIDIQANILHTKELIDLLNKISPEQIEANLFFKGLNATHTISMKNGIIFDEGIDGKLIKWTQEEFTNEYNSKWSVNFVID